MGINEDQARHCEELWDQYPKNVVEDILDREENLRKQHQGQLTKEEIEAIVEWNSLSNAGKAHLKTEGAKQGLGPFEFLLRIYNKKHMDCSLWRSELNRVLREQ